MKTRLWREALAPVAACCAVSLSMLTLDTDARQLRSSSAKAAFKASQPCPANGNSSRPCPGYAIDHVVPLVCGGADSPVNMQWQTIAAAREKDKWETLGCKSGARAR